MAEAVEPLGLSGEVEIVANPAGGFDPRNDFASVALYFGARGLAADDDALEKLMRDGTPVVPVVSDIRAVSEHVPRCLQAINALEVSAADVALHRPVTLALEVLGLLPRQRRIFISYRRSEAADTALQLFERMSRLTFDVFLDTHGVPPGDDFQEVLWHRLSDSDVLVMLDTASYFESRWTRQEFGRALARSLVPLRIGWPGVVQSARSLAAESLQLSQDDFEADGRRLKNDALSRIALAVERARSRGIAVRSAEMNSAVVVGAMKLDGKFLSLGPKRTIIVELHSGKKVLVYPSIGVPTAEHLHEVSMIEPADIRAVVFDDAGISPHWQRHLKWLSGQISSARLLRKGQAAWDLADLSD